jgi:glutamate/tyrosine decarboxylase-like PLP-dependent enzyme
MHYLGEEGFLKLAKKAKEATDKLTAGINEVSSLYVLGNPDATVFAFGSDEINVYELVARLKECGWHLDAQHLPPSLHMTVSPIHSQIVDPFLADLRETVQDTPAIDSKEISEQAAMYGMIGGMADRKMASEFTLGYLDDLYKPK